jgi:hypothetical protein
MGVSEALVPSGKKIIPKKGRQSNENVTSAPTVMN